MSIPRSLGCHENIDAPRASVYKRTESASSLGTSGSPSVLRLSPGRITDGAFAALLVPALLADCANSGTLMVVSENAEASPRAAIEFKQFIGGSTMDSKKIIFSGDQRATLRIHSKKKPTEKAENRSLSRCSVMFAGGLSGIGPSGLWWY